MAMPHSPAPHHSAALDRWRRIEALLHAWLEQRRRLLVLLCSIQGLEGFQRPGSVQTQVREFCQLLMDYISAGHFEIYQELVREARLGAARRDDFGVFEGPSDDCCRSGARRSGAAAVLSRLAVDLRRR